MNEEPTSQPTSSQAAALLHKHFGHRAFRPGQEEIIASVLGGHDTLAVMPTGGGKSLCYQIPALMQEGTALVVSPLIALMKDQADALRRAGISAGVINSTVHYNEIQQRMTNARFGAYKLLYVAPERLESPQFLEQLRDVRISFLAVDEAHCISEWGHDFRPAYMNIPHALSTLPRVPVIALTATATAEVRSDIVKALSMNDARTFVKGFDRPNLSYHSEYCEDKIPRVIRLAESIGNGSVIVYAGSRRKVEETASALVEAGMHAAAYHAGLNDEIRRDTQERFLSGEIPILTATSAFGMGVDKPDVRLVIHTGLTLTLEAYYQEAGRAGRDGEASRCIALYRPDDRELQEFFLRNIYPQADDIRHVYSFLYDTAGVARGDRAMSPLYVDDVVIANRLNMSASLVGGVLGLLERSKIIRRGSNNYTARLHLSAEPERIREYFHHTTPDRRGVLEMLLRGVGPEALRSSVSLDLNALCRKHDVPYDRCIDALRAFERARLLHFEPAAGSGGIVLLEERTAVTAIPYDKDALELRRRKAHEKLDAVIHYMQSSSCKRNLLLEYFGDPASDICGRCSSCIASPADAASGASTTATQDDASLSEGSPEYLIIHAVEELGERFGRTTVAAVLVGETSASVQNFALHQSAYFAALNGMSLQRVVELIDAMVRRKLLQQSAGNRPVVSLRPKAVTLLSAHRPPPLTIRFSNHDTPDLSERCAELERVRTEIASRHGVPPRSIMSDKQLKEFARAQPATIEECARIKGLHTVFVQKYAHEFLAAGDAARAREYAQEQEGNLDERERNVLECVRSGMTVADIAARMREPEGIVAGTLHDMIAKGVAMPTNMLVSTQVVELVRRELRRHPRAFVKDLRAILGPDISVVELRIAGAIVRSQESL